MNSPLARVPCTIITGFLGAGKTTLIRHLLANTKARRLAVIVNEFGDVGIDGEILKGCGDAACPEENIVELANGCLCCTVADEFVPALDAILAKGGIEHIVIETSGLALPKPLVQAFHWPAIKSRVTVDGVVVVVDGAALADGRVAQDLEALKRQRSADLALDHDDPIEEVFEDMGEFDDVREAEGSGAAFDGMSGSKYAVQRLVVGRNLELQQSALDIGNMFGTFLQESIPKLREIYLHSASAPREVPSRPFGEAFPDRTA